MSCRSAFREDNIIYKNFPFPFVQGKREVFYCLLYSEGSTGDTYRRISTAAKSLTFVPVAPVMISPSVSFKAV